MLRRAASVCAVLAAAAAAQDAAAEQDSVPAPPLRPLVVSEAPRGEAKAGSTARHYLSGLTISPRLAYFYYYELFPASERAVTEPAGYPVVGEPKSLEHGVCEGLQLEYLAALGDVVFLRPKLGGYLGLLHKYDGTKQGQLTRDPVSGDTVLEYEPIELRKSNFFVHGALDIGAGYLSPTWGLSAYTGIELRLWSRHLDLFGRSKEYYYWASAPLGVLAYVHVSPKVRLGLDAAATFFLTGNMAIRDGGRASASSIDWPAVHLSDSADTWDRVGVRISLPLELTLRPALNVRIVPWFEYYRFEKSNLDSVLFYDPDYSPPNVTVVFYEPASRTYWWGLSLDFVIHRRRYR